MNDLIINDNSEFTRVWEPWNLTEQRAMEIKDEIIATSKLMEHAKMPFNLFSLLRNCLQVAKTSNEQGFIIFTLGEFSGERRQTEPIAELVDLLKLVTKRNDTL